MEASNANRTFWRLRVRVKARRLRDYTNASVTSWAGHSAQPCKNLLLAIANVNVCVTAGGAT